MLECQSLEMLRVEMEVYYIMYPITCSGMQLFNTNHNFPIPQAASLPKSDEKIENITIELVQKAMSVSKQLAVATGVKEVSLLPLDLKSTNYIIAQVQ